MVDEFVRGDGLCNPSGPSAQAGGWLWVSARVRITGVYEELGLAVPGVCANSCWVTYAPAGGAGAAVSSLPRGLG